MNEQSTPPEQPEQPERRRLLAALSSSVALAACGGGGGGDSPAPAPPGPPPSPPVDGPAWRGFGSDPQHSAQAGVATQALNRIAWQTPVDLAPTYSGSSLLAHYGSPLSTAKNTIIVPVKTGSGGGFRVEARAGGNGVLIWQADSDYLFPPNNVWTPSWNPALSAASRLYMPGAGGKLLYRDNADAATGAVQIAVFYGKPAYDAAPATFNNSVFINTPLTVDAAGNVYFGFVVNGANPANLVSGIARLAPDGSGTWVGAAAAANDNAISKVPTNCAPALSPDGQTLYVAVNLARVSGQVQRGLLLALDSTTLATKARVALLDPSSGLSARLSDDATSSPTVGPDGDVYYGVLANTTGNHNSRGWLLHFDAGLAQTKLPGSFGWDNTPSVLPASIVSGYSGTSSYLLMCKYNNYLGTATGDGNNKIAIVDPFASQADPITPAVSVMREVLTKSGPTPEAGEAPPAVREWCINTAAVDLATKSVVANSEDGVLYRWDLTTNTFTQSIRLTAGIGEAYTPTAIGADGAVLAINNAILFSIAR